MLTTRPAAAGTDSGWAGLFRDAFKRSRNPMVLTDSSRVGLRPWLLVDRDRRRLSFGTAAEVWNVLERGSAVPDSRAQPARHPREQRRLKRKMSAWLDWMSGRRGLAQRPRR